jgi:hypothetical protein
MPYFIRRPYDATSAQQQAKRQPKEIDVLELARNVLSLETSVAAEGPFRMRGPLQPGECGAMVLELALDMDGPPLTINLKASDLVGTDSLLGADSVRIDPSVLTLRTTTPAQVTVTVQVPADARSGRYAGTLSATGDETFAVAFQVEVR